jgi:hypothetical protein
MTLSSDEKRALAALLDVIVPPHRERGLPGAGQLGVGDLVEEGLCERPELRAGLVEALARLDRLAAARGSRRTFAQLDASGRRAVLDAASAELPDFLGPLVLQTYLGYYRHPRVLEALGLEVRPPYPGGYAVPPTDFSILDRVRRKTPFYRRP